MAQAATLWGGHLQKLPSIRRRTGEKGSLRASEEAHG